VSPRLHRADEGHRLLYPFAGRRVSDCLADLFDPVDEVAEVAVAARSVGARGIAHRRRFGGDGENTPESLTGEARNSRI